MGRKLDLTAKKFGRLTVNKRIVRRMSGRNRTYWECKCQCGNTVVVLSHSLVRGCTRSCGCLRSDSSRERHLTHGKTGSPEFSVWCAMRKRCRDPKDTGYQNYGGRGVRVCERWLDKNGFANFLADMGSKPSPDYTIERIDNAGDYCPDNCVWIPKSEQTRNTRRNVIITHRGESMILQDWADKIGISRGALDSRLRRGWSIERALTTPLHSHG